MCYRNLFLFLTVTYRLVVYQKLFAGYAWESGLFYGVMGCFI